MIIYFVHTEKFDNKSCFVIFKVLIKNNLTQWLVFFLFYKEKNIKLIINLVFVTESFKNGMITC